MPTIEFSDRTSHDMFSRHEMDSIRAAEAAAPPGCGGLLSALRLWRELANHVAHYGDSIDEYTNDVSVRDWIDRVAGLCEEGVRMKIASMLQDSDKVFEQHTVLDSERWIARYYKYGDGWWWRRRPRSGRLAEWLGAQRD